MDLVVEGGVDGFSMHRLARAVGCTPGALYRYFPSKEALLATLEARVIARFDAYLQTVREEISARATAARSRARVRPLAGLLGVARAYAALSRKAADEFELLAFFIGDPRPLVPDAEAAGVMTEASRILELVAELFERAGEARALSPGNPIDRAASYWAGLHGVLQTRKLMRIAPALLDTDRLAGDLPRTLLSGWGASEKNLEQAEALLDEMEEDRSLIARALAGGEE